MIINTYKPKGITSFDVVAKVRKALNIRKVGHAGTLDPLAEGVLVVLTEKDTKKQQDFMKLDKEYVASIAFGISSPTYDLEGEVSFNEKNPLIEDIKKQLVKLIGIIEQTVPAYSAVRVNGQRLYKKARKGKLNSADLPKRMVTIYDIEIISFQRSDVNLKDHVYNLPVLECKITCSSGTYIRSIANDLGGVLVKLVRTKIGSYDVKDSVDLKNLPDLVLPESSQS